MFYFDSCCCCNDERMLSSRQMFNSVLSLIILDTNILITFSMCWDCCGCKVLGKTTARTYTINGTRTVYISKLCGKSRKSRSDKRRSGKRRTAFIKAFFWLQTNPYVSFLWLQKQELRYFYWLQHLVNRTFIKRQNFEVWKNILLDRLHYLNKIMDKEWMQLSQTPIKSNARNYSLKMTKFNGVTSQ